MKILIIGGTKGLGKEIHTRSFFNQEVELNSVINLSRTTSPKLDLSWEEDQIKQVVRDTINDELGGLDILVVSSGQGAYHSPLVSELKVKELFQVNVFGPMAVYKAALKALLKSKGKAIFISSTAARRPGSGGLSIYGSTKAALNSWVMSEGRRAAKAGIAMCAVSPGFFESEMVSDLKDNVRESATKAIPFGRFGTSPEVADFVVSLYRQSNWCLAGQIFDCSGGA